MGYIIWVYEVGIEALKYGMGWLLIVIIRNIIGKTHGDIINDG